MTIVLTALTLLCAVTALAGVGWLMAKIGHQREQLDTHQSKVDLEREIYTQSARSQGFFHF